MSESTNTEGAVIRAYQDGPLLVRGAFELRDETGAVIDPGRATIALCRCGRSALKPLCDGSHALAGKRRKRPTTK
ncbi:CDGSH iron-sulfur domain-containing protein [Kribbella qitaiheensis]|uniref:CDGSH iron-sulfur domain-containing protein n=1 Tax=Kribbella qitaiheensis TaxID=1544730 RepID=A0A7G6WTU0_9ACTN|nr:CDGSH iron-sulfur domain-containing protein [Kribbella qitaiheensis]QNE17405.1 CDGSH iron-sulfur domain-containing protein [Kribbella qitaiheensis]